MKEEIVSEELKDGRIHNIQYLDGKKRREFFTRDWHLEGVERWWWPNGELHSEGVYKNGVEVKPAAKQVAKPTIKPATKTRGRGL